MGKNKRKKGKIEQKRVKVCFGIFFEEICDWGFSFNAAHSHSVHLFYCKYFLFLSTFSNWNSWFGMKLVDIRIAL